MAIDETESRYRCCCGACRAKTGGICVAVFEGLVALTFLIFAIVFQTQQAGRDQQKYLNAAASIFYVLAVLLLAFVAVLVLGLALRRGWLLIIHMLKSGLFVAICSILMILGILVIITAGTGALAMGVISDNDATHPQREAKETFVGLTVAAIICVIVLGVYAILQIWFILVILSAYRAVRDTNNTRGGVVLVPPPQTMTSTHDGTTNYPSNVYQTTTYYPGGGTNAPPATSYAQMTQGTYPSAPPPYMEKV